MIKVTCTNCGKAFKTRDEYAGRKAKCSACGSQLIIPSPPASPEVAPVDISPSAAPLPAPVVEAQPTLTAARLPRIGIGLGIAGIAIPLLDLAALIASGIALSSYDEKQHEPGDRKLAIIGISLGLGGLILKGCVLTAVLAWLMLDQQSQPPAPLPTVVQTAPLVAPPEVPPPVAPPPVAAPLPSPPPVSNTVYYYDLGTDQLFAAKPSKVTPIDAPSGKDLGVRAFVFSCGDCSDPSQRTVAWLERNTAAGRKAIENPNAMSIDDTIDSLMAQVELSEDGGKKWRALHAMQYLQWRMEKARTICPGTVTAECKP